MQYRALIVLEWVILADAVFSYIQLSSLRECASLSAYR